jgi:hypothetical protein
MNVSSETPLEVVTVLSSDYSGSHFLSLLLGAHTEMAHLGEVHRLHRGRWSSVCTTCGREPCPVFAGVAAAPETEPYSRVFDNLSGLGRPARVLVDASKRVSWASRHAGSPYRMRYIHLIRDPRALVRRWLLRDRTRRQRVSDRVALLREHPRVAPVARIASSRHPTIRAYRWLSENENITSFLESQSREHRIVTYRDLAVATESTLRGITEWIGLPYEDAQLQYWRHEHHGTMKLEYAWVAEQQTVGYFDTRWRDELPARTLVRLRHDRYLARYIESLGLRWLDDGLSSTG